ncbi:CoA-binding protein [Winogradskyella sp. DF17]|uniref:CoA-binding protein n=1 Tax=Winogradskyella pelagia TaxID=2819984 RepID=A0ABS3T1Z3_9FLAO|nr:CoA-binding protein [Winogradskyella sp. DF17]MBO3116768.1 CoA-binding protein [Winogradskyella sp. DF17]
MKNTLVFGASLKPNRYANMAMIRLQQTGHNVKAFGLREGEVSGINIDTELKAYKDIHTVTLYLNPKRQDSYYDYIISLRPKRVIFNPGTENPEFYTLLKAHDINFEVACTLVLLGTNQY